MPTRRRRLIYTLSALLVGIVVLAALLWPSTIWARAGQLAGAEQRWAQRTFVHYRLHVRDKGCLQQIEIRNERVLRVAPNRCDATPRSVGELFKFIRRDGTVSHACIYQGCLCDDVIYISALYNDQLGYPTRILVRIRAEPNWRRLDFWQHALARQRFPNCSELGEGSKLIEIVNITPVSSS